MANMELMLEAERRGILPPDKQAILNEARKRGLAPLSTGQFVDQRSVESSPSFPEALNAQEILPPEDTFLNRLSAYVNDRGKEVSDIQNYTRANNQGKAREIFRTLGPGMGFIGDLGGEALSAAGNALSYITPDSIESPIKSGAVSALSTIGKLPSFSGRTIGEDIPQEIVMTAEKYEALKKSNPGLAMDLGGANALANLAFPLASKGGAIVLDKAVTAPVKLANAARPKLGKQQRLLQNMGVRLTSGQRSGGIVKSIEDKATSIPIVGDAINASRTRSIVDFNKGVADDVLSSINKKIPKKIEAGRDLISFTKEEISNSYNEVLPKMTGVFDDDFVKGWDDALSGSSLLPTEKAKQVQKILDDILKKRAPNGVVTGTENKEIMERLGKKAAQYSKSLDPDQQAMGDIFHSVKNEYSAMLERNNPGELAKKLKDTDLAFAKYVRMEKAAASVGNDNGIFTPSQLQSAVKSSDNSVRKGAFARGDALLQEISDAGKAVLPNKIPDSGTASRLMLGAGTALAGGGAAFMTPAILPLLAAGALATGAYTRPGQFALRNLSKLIRR